MSTNTTDSQNVPNKATVVHKFPKSENTEIRATVRSYHGRDLIDLRMFLMGANGFMIPTKRGISLGFRHVDDLALAVAALKEEIERREGMAA